MELRKLGRGIASFLPHLLMAYSWMLLTFYVINLFNDSMGFLNSGTSRHFEVVYVTVALLTAVSAVLRKYLRIPAAITAVTAIVFVIPVIRAIAQNSPLPLDTAFFQAMSLVFSLVTLTFSIACIVVQRIRAKKETM